VSGWPAPIEWVPGRSRWPWLVGYLAIFSITLVTAELAIYPGLSWAGITFMSPKLTLIVQLAAIAITVGPSMLWMNLVPVPAHRLGLSPEGVVIDYGLRSERFSWDRTSLRGMRLEVLSPWLGLRSSYSLTPYQAGRVTYLRPVPR